MERYTVLTATENLRSVNIQNYECAATAVAMARKFLDEGLYVVMCREGELRNLLHYFLTF